MHKLFAFLLVPCLFINLTITLESDLELKRWISTLKRTVDYICKQFSQMNLDAAFGLALTEAHLSSVKTENIPTQFKEKLRSIVFRSSECRNKISSTISPNNTIALTLRDEITNPNFWKPKAKIKKSYIIEYNPDQHLTKAQALDLLNKGFPQEKQSDYCLANLFSVSETNCEISPRCFKMLDRRDNSNGYPLLHRVLYILTHQNRMQCTKIVKLFYDKMLEIYCERTFRSVFEIARAGLYDKLKDFVMESNLLCGMAGYTDFINRDFISDIVNWQQQTGCYGTSPHSYAYKTYLNEVDRCDSHTTAVAVATLGLSIKTILDSGQG